MVGGYNQSVILDAVRRAPSGLSQVELIEVTALSKQTVSNITRRLLEDGWFTVVGATAAGRGKPRTVISVNAERVHAVGVHLDPSITTATLLDLGGKTVATVSSAAVIDDDPRASIARVATLVEKMIDESGVDRASITGVGIAAPGPMNIEQGRLVSPPKLIGWDQFAVREAAGELFEYPVIVDKDMFAATTGECWARDHADGDSMLFIYVGTGIGCGIAINGNVVRGLSNNAGEIGHMVIDTQGTPCSCGRRGCLGRATDPHRLYEEAVASGLLSPRGEPHDFDAVHRGLIQLRRLAEEGVPSAIVLMNRAASALAEAARMLVSLHDASLVVFGGPFWTGLSEHYLEVIRPALANAPEVRSILPRIESTILGDEVVAAGAACLVFDAQFSTRLSAYQLAGSIPSTPSVAR